MNYELALKLKNAGFPTNVDGRWDGFINGTLDKHTSETLFIPTLEVLIEACGDAFSDLLTKIPHQEIGEDILELSKQKPLWSARAWIGTFPITTNGSTPQECMANLWLELNKK